MSKRKRIPTFVKQKSNTLGGTDIIYQIFEKHRISGFIQRTLGRRSPRGEYKYSEGVLAKFMTFCCGGTRLEDMDHERIGWRFKFNPHFYSNRVRKYKKSMSPDTFSRMCNELKTKNDTYVKDAYLPNAGKPKKKKSKSNSKKEELKLVSNEALHEINFNLQCNDLFFRFALEYGLLKRGVPYILDLDSSVIQNKISDSRKYYNGHGKTGYQPMMASIGDIPVYIETRNGDTPSHWNLKKTVEFVLNRLQMNGIIVDTVRIDAAGYNAELICFLNKIGLQYVTRAKIGYKKKKFLETIGYDWLEDVIRSTKVRLTEEPSHFGAENQRLIITQKKSDESYWAILTNIQNSSMKDICEMYNKRNGHKGVGEHIFKMLKSNFSWQFPQHRSLEKNSVFFCVTAFHYCLYKFLLRLLHATFKNVMLSMTIKSLILHFMNVSIIYVEGKIKIESGKAKHYLGLSGFI